MPQIALDSDGLRLLLPLLQRASAEEADAMDDLRGDDSDRVFYQPYLDHLTRKWHYDSMLHHLERAIWRDGIEQKRRTSDAIQ